MRAIPVLFRRNLRLFFKDKGMFLTSLITPVILLALFIVFLGSIYRDGFLALLPASVSVDDMLLSGVVGGQIVSSILSVSCVTVSFSANLLMVQDKANGARRDLTVAPVPHSALAIAYFAAGFTASLIIGLVALIAGLIYLAVVGWYLTAADVLLLFADVILMTLFGTALASVAGHFLSTQGHMSAVSTIVSTGYGYLSGAYMPLSNFGEALQNILACLPGTYGTVLMRRHTMQGALRAMESLNISDASMQLLRDRLDCNLYFFGTQVSDTALFLVPVAAVAALIIVFVFLQRFSRR